MDLQYCRTFNEDTSQGIVGLLKPLSTSKKLEKVFTLNQSTLPSAATNYFFVKDDPAYPIYVFKIPKEVNTLVDHEFKVAKDMEDLTFYLPHFNRVFEIKREIKCHVPDKLKKIKNGKFFNPFDTYNCTRDVLILEYIPSTLTLLEYLKSTKFNNTSEALIHQLILALIIAQQEKNFTHYDLHLENILLRRCLQRTFFWYKFKYEEVVINRLVYTNGYFPVLFDYGFAYSKGLEGTSYNNSLFFTNKGYTPFMFDDINDFKTLLVRLAYIKGCPQKIKNLTNKKFLKSNELKFELSKETGWIKSTISSSARVVCKKLEKIIEDLVSDYKNCFIYNELDNIVDIFGILIKLPIDHNNFKTKKLATTVANFLVEWEKIDLWFKNTVPDDKLNMFKKILESINELILEENCDKVKDYLKICHNFKLKMFEIFDGFGDYVDIQDLDYGKLLSSIIEISNFIEYIVYAENQRCKKLFNFKLNGWDLFTSIEDLIMVKEPYNFQLNDHMVLFDCIQKTTSSFDLKDKELIETLNSASNLNQQINIFTNLQLKEL